MTVRLDQATIRLDGACAVDEAETLSTLLRENSRRVVDVSDCTRLHAAVLQVLLVFRPALQGHCRDAFLEQAVFTRLRERV
jgi:hypothetical protein